MMHRIQVQIAQSMNYNRKSYKETHPQIRRLHVTFRFFYISYLILSLLCLARMLIVGYYNVIGLSTMAAVDIVYLFLKIQLFFMLSRWSLDLKLKT